LFDDANHPKLSRANNWPLAFRNIRPAYWSARDASRNSRLDISWMGGFSDGRVFVCGKRAQDD
jgi:hypothetical protein